MNKKRMMEKAWVCPFAVRLLGLLVLAGGCANAQTDSRMAAAEQGLRSVVSAQLNAAAQAARVSLLPGEIAYAGGNGGFVVNGAVSGVEQLAPQSLARETDLLFTDVGAPGLSVPIGYYKVRLIGRQAQFIGDAGKVVATLPANVTQQAGAASPAARAKVKVKLSASWGKNGLVIDIEIDFGAASSAIVIPIPQLGSR